MMKLTKSATRFASRIIRGLLQPRKKDVFASAKRKPPAVPLYMVLLFVAFSTAALAGPEDQGSRYPVRIAIGGAGGLLVGGIVDSGGTTSLSYEDAIDAGLLDTNGDPVSPPDGSRSIGGTGGGSVAAHQFNNVTIKVTPLNANGTANGDTREVKVTVVVPKKPADQTGADDAAKTKKTSSLTTKLGANVAGATLGGGQIRLTDKATNNPAKNDRSTGWTNAAPGEAPSAPQIQIPLVPKDPVDNDIKRSQIPGINLNGFLVTADITSLPTTLIPQSMISLLGLIPVGTFVLDDIAIASLFAEGYIDAMPGDTLALQYGFIDLSLPALTGPFEILHVAAMINPFSDDILIGANGLVPANWDGWLDNSAHLFNLAASATVPEPGTLVLLLAVAAGWFLQSFVITRRRR